MMDRALKERVLGAVILVVFTVLVVPVFLDGSTGDAESVQKKIILPGQDSEGSRRKTIVLERDRKQPVPQQVTKKVTITQNPPVLEKVVVEAQAQAAKPEPKKAAEPLPAPEKPKATPVSKQQSTTGMWAVQLGSFSSRENAERLASDLRKQGYSAFLGQLKTASGQLHRVRIGPQKDRASAESMAAKLRTQGHQGQVVTHP